MIPRRLKTRCQEQSADNGQRQSRARGDYLGVLRKEMAENYWLAALRNHPYPSPWSTGRT